MIQLKCQLFLCCDILFTPADCGNEELGLSPAECCEILFTPARLDCGNEELVMKLKCQLKETQGVGVGAGG